MLIYSMEAREPTEVIFAFLLANGRAYTPVYSRMPL